MISKRKRVFLFILVAIFLVFLVLYTVGFIISGSSNTSKKDSIVRIVFNNCSTYEKLGEDFVENSEHDGGCEFFDVEGLYSEYRIDGYKHIHYLLPRTNGGYYCAAIGNDNLKYILSLDDKMVVDSFVEVRNLPSKLYEHKGTVAAYYICDGEAELYSVDFQMGKQIMLVDGISIADSWSIESIKNHYKDEQKYFDIYEYEYEKYLKSGKDLMFTLFDFKCFESVYLNDTSVVYKTDKTKNEHVWIAKQKEEEICFSNSDRCFGFVGESELLFYKCLNLGLYDVGCFYKYDYVSEIKSDFKVVFNKGITQGEIFDDKDNFYFTSSDWERPHYYCMDVETYERYDILTGCSIVGYFSRPYNAEDGDVC